MSTSVESVAVVDPTAVVVAVASGAAGVGEASAKKASSAPTPTTTHSITTPTIGLRGGPAEDGSACAVISEPPKLRAARREPS